MENGMSSPIYDIHKSYLENFETGPFFDGEIPERIFPTEDKWIDFLGFKVASRIGVPAGPLLNAKWALFAAKLGFDIVTYKTIRSRFHPAHPAPNMIYVDTQGPLQLSRAHETLKQAMCPPANMESLAVTNSFGIPSRDEEYLLQDIACANRELQPGQVMIVSIVGTPRDGEDFVQDFARCAQIALDAGAKIIEADFSCPNVTTCEGNLFESPEMVLEICRCIKKTIGALPLIIKLGVIADEKRLQEVMCAAAKAGVQAICGINTMSMSVVNERGEAALGPKRLKSGVCGGPIREVALDFVQKSRKINDQNKLDLTIMATGGACSPGHFDLFFEAGADIAMSAVGMLWDPFLAIRYHNQGA